MELLDAWRVSPGVYRIMLDYPEDPVGGVGVIVTGVGFNLDWGVNMTVALAANEVFDHPGDRLVIEVVAVTLINDPLTGFIVFANMDTMFAMCVFDAQS